MVNDNLSDIIMNQLTIQLHINEVITGEQFDIRLAANPDYAYKVKTLRTRVLVTRNFQNLNNREYMDVVLYCKYGLISIATNCFGPPGQTYLVKDIHWGALCIYNTDPTRTCSTCSSCGCNSNYMCDGYCGCGSLYYPATYDPNYPAENHDYNLVKNTGTFGRTYSSNDRCLCSRYQCNSEGCVGVSDCRLVKA